MSPAEAARLAALRASLGVRELGAIRGDVPNPVLDPIIAGDGVTIWFGDGGVGKTTLGMASIGSVALGHAVIEGLPQPRKGRGVFLDFEHHAQSSGARARALFEDAADAIEIDYVPCSGTLTRSKDLREFLALLRPDVVLIDSLARSVQGGILDPEAAAGFFDAVQQWDCPVLVLAHVAKDDHRRKPAGLNAWHDGARSTWHLSLVRRRPHTIAMKQQKDNDHDLSVAPLLFEIHYEADRTTVRRLGSDRPASDEAAEDVVDVVTTIYEATGEAVRATDVEAHIGLKRSRTHQLIARAVKDGSLDPVNGGRMTRYRPGKSTGGANRT